jgi:hypothetical protein
MFTAIVYVLPILVSTFIVKAVKVDLYRFYNNDLETVQYKCFDNKFD